MEAKRGKWDQPRVSKLCTCVLVFDILVRVYRKRGKPTLSSLCLCTHGKQLAGPHTKAIFYRMHCAQTNQLLTLSDPTEGHLVTLSFGTHLSKNDTLFAAPPALTEIGKRSPLPEPFTFEFGPHVLMLSFSTTLKMPDSLK